MPEELKQTEDLIDVGETVGADIELNEEKVTTQVTIDYLKHLENGNVNMIKQKAKLQKVIKGLNKASKLHAGQAKILKGMVNGKKDKPTKT